jgi:hypothetical protein
LLDENILETQRVLLHAWHIRARQIGVDVASKGIKDEAIIPLLHDIGRVTFLTRDLGFFQRDLVHRAYCLVCLDVGQYEAASFVRRFLHHPRFSTERKRDGSVVRVSHRSITRFRGGGVDEILTW